MYTFLFLQYIMIHILNIENTIKNDGKKSSRIYI